MNKKTTFSAWSKDVNIKIKDPVLKELLFGIDEVEGSDIKGIGVLYKMMTFTFMFAYAKYKYDRNNISSSSASFMTVCIAVILV